MSKKKWSLSRNEVATKLIAGSRSGRFSNRSKQSRANDERSMVITLVHKPSGVEISEEISEGNYSRKELRKRKEKIVEILLAKLEDKVARLLRIPGR